MGIATYSYNRSTSGGEIIRELVNASDGQGLHFANGAALLLAYASGGVFGTADFSIEFILDQDADNSSDNEIYTSQIAGSNVLKVTNSISSNVVRISFDSTNYDIAYDMSGDYGTPTHYVLTCDRSALATLYKNGNSVGTINISGSSAVNLGNGNTANGYLGGVSGYGAIGSYYRWRTWKKLLSSAEVAACYENASVPIADQWSNCVTDLDLAFANPERSLAVRSKSGVGNATASAGVFQLNPIEQLNSKSARIGTSAATPADGEIIADKVGIGLGAVAPTASLDVRRGDASGKIAEFQNSTGYGVDIGTSIADAYISSGYAQNLILKTDPGAGQVARLTISSAGNVGIGVTPSTWADTGLSNIQVANNGHITSVNEYLYIGSNYHYNNGWKRTTTNKPSTKHEFGNGTHKFSVAPTGAAGSTITWTDGLTIDNAGAVSIPSAAGTQIALTVKGGNNLVDNIALNVTNQAGDTGTNIRNNGQLFTSSLATFSNGIAFQSATTGSGTGTGYTLDSYEVGTFTPVVADAGTGGNVASVAGPHARYTKIGNRVYCQVSLVNITTTGMIAGNTLHVRGLPFTSISTANFYSPVNVFKGAITSSEGVILGLIHPNTDYMSMYNGISATAGHTAALVSQITSGNGDMYMSFQYETAL